MNSSSSNLITLIGRVLIVSLFIPAGIGKLGNFAGTVGYVGSAGLPMPEVGAAIAIFVEVLVALCLLVGWQARWAALIMAMTVANKIVGLISGILMRNSVRQGPAPSICAASCTSAGTDMSAAMNNTNVKPTCCQTTIMTIVIFDQNGSTNHGIDGKPIPFR